MSRVRIKHIIWWCVGVIILAVATIFCVRVFVYSHPDTAVNQANVSVRNVPLLTITTSRYVNEIKSKNDYLDATIKLDGFGLYSDFIGKGKVRGRGNTTWEADKKPYKLKFSKSTSLCGLTPAKKYVLLANYFDPTQMQNALAMKIAELLDMPYVNHIIPVNVVFNGCYKGAYMLSEQVGLNNASVDLNKDNAMLWKLDVNFNEDYKFKSPIYKIPVLAKNKNLTNRSFWYWQKDFIDFEKAVARGNNISDVLDMQSAVNFMLLNNVCLNLEFCFPKSVYLYKTKGNVYHFGPVWDYDWCFGITDEESVERINTDCFLLNFDLGHTFFSQICHDNDFMPLYKQTWERFKAEKLPEFWTFFDEYAALIEQSVQSNNEVWQQHESQAAALKRLRTWIEARIAFISYESHNYGLY